MKRLLQRRAFFPPMLGILLLASFWLTSGVAFAATTQIHQPASAQDITNVNNCKADATWPPVVIVTDGGWNVDCFSGSGSEPVGLSDVTALETNAYSISFTWTDYQGGIHASNKGAYVFLAAGNASSSNFGGYGSIAKITSLTIEPVSSFPIVTCLPGDVNSVWMATNAPPSNVYYIDCFNNNATGVSPHAYKVNLYGVYAIETNAYALTFTWTDYYGGNHTSVLPPGTLLAAGDASPIGFAKQSQIAHITSITLD